MSPIHWIAIWVEEIPFTAGGKRLNKPDTQLHDHR
jgi:hypothetical protein